MPGHRNEVRYKALIRQCVCGGLLGLERVEVALRGGQAGVIHARLDGADVQPSAQQFGVVGMAQ